MLFLLFSTSYEKSKQDIFGIKIPQDEKYVQVRTQNKIKFIKNLHSQKPLCNNKKKKLKFNSSGFTSSVMT